MDVPVDSVDTVTSEWYPELSSQEIADVVIRCLIFIVGIIGNALVIFFILFLNEFQKLSHWYVLQLALADFLFLFTLPFRISEILHKRWIYPVSLCQARQTILFFNYYASILFLMIMALDRYFAVCHALSSRIQRLRSRTNSYILTALTWAVALVLCIPVMMYSDMVGNEPNCICTLDFPKDRMHWCKLNMPQNVTECYESLFDNFHDDTCSPDLSNDRQSNSTGSGSDYDSSFDFSLEGSIFDEYWENMGSNETVVVPTGDGTYVPQSEFILQNGCYIDAERTGWHVFTYFNFVVMFIIPLLVISLCYASIVARLMSANVGDRRGSTASQPASTKRTSRKRLWRSSRRRSSTASTGHAQREKTRVAHVCALLVVLFIVCWLPFHSVHLAKISGISGDSTFCAGLASATSILAYLNSALNPYLYNFLGTFHKRMRQIRDHKRTRSFLSATGLTRIVGRSSSVVHSSDSSREKAKRSSVPNGSRSGSVTNEKIALRTIDRGETTSSH